MQDRKIGPILAAVLLLAAAAIAVVSYKPGIPRHDLNMAYYSDDGGQTYFEDSAYKFAPWDHDGRTAMMASVYSEDGRKYIAYLSRFTPQAKKRLEDAYSADPTHPEKLAVVMMSIGPAGTEVSLPGPTQKWLPGYDLKSLNLQPPGPDPPTPVIP